MLIFAGAAAVAVGTANFINPTAAVDVLDGLMTYMREEKIGGIRDLTGAAHAE